jgi:hypothetical protein
MSIDLGGSFLDRFKINPKNSDIRNRIIETGNKRDFFIDKSCMVTGSTQMGLFSKRSFTKGTFLGTYRGELCNVDDLQNIFTGPNVDFDPVLNITWDSHAYSDFIKKYNIQTKLSSRETCNLMVKLGFAIPSKAHPDAFLVMPRYPIDPEFYGEYNAMLYVNEPPNCKSKYNSHLGNEQLCEINVLAFTNYQWNTIDYVAAKDIQPNEELLVYYGNRYQRRDYTEGINIDGCNREQNKVFF